MNTGEWIEFHNYQLICTCINIKNISNRFLNLVHLINLSYPNLDELALILNNSMLTKLNLEHQEIDWNKNLVNNYTSILDSLINGLRNDKYELQVDLSSLDALRNAQRIIDKLSRYEHLNERSFIREIQDALYNKLSTGQQTRNLSSIIRRKFTSDDLDQFYLTCDQFGAKLVEQDYADFEYKWRTIIDSWCSENDYLQRKLCLTKEFLNLLSSINCFLCDENEGKIQALFLLGAHGTGRKLFSSIAANHLNYDKIWTIEESLTDKQLNNEIKNLFEELDDGKNAKGLQNSQNNRSNELKELNEIKKILIVLDEMHFQMMPYLQKTIFLLISEYNEFLRNKTNNLIIKIIILNSKLTDENYHLWNSVSLFKKVLPLSDQSLLSFTVQLIDEYIAFDEQKKFLINTNQSKQMNSDEDDGFDDEFDDNDLAEELANMLVKINNTFKDLTGPNLRIYHHLIETFRLIFNHEQTLLLDKRERLSLGKNNFFLISIHIHISIYF